MIIFAKKHFSQKNARLFSFLINMAIYFRASLSILKRFLSAIFFPLLDTVMIYAGIYMIKHYWEQYIIYLDGGQYPVEFITIAVPLYIFVWLFSVFLSGGYDRPVRLRNINRGIFIGTVAILVIYALISETYRYSRALIILGALWGMISMMGLRFIFHLLGIKKYRLGESSGKRFIIIGDKLEAERVAEMLRKTHLTSGFIGLASVTDNNNRSEGFIGNISQIIDIINIYKIDEVIFCAKDISSNRIIDIMSDLHDSRVEYKIAPPESLSIIGSNSISTSGDPYIIDIDSIDKINNRRNKRFLDFIVSICLITSLPVTLFIVRKPIGFLRNIFFVLFGKKSWTGFYINESTDIVSLPKIRPGVLNPSDAFLDLYLSDETRNRLNLLYARDYKLSNELNIISKGFRNLGRN